MSYARDSFALLGVSEGYKRAVAMKKYLLRISNCKCFEDLLRDDVYKMRHTRDSFALLGRSRGHKRACGNEQNIF